MLALKKSITRFILLFLFFISLPILSVASDIYSNKYNLAVKQLRAGQYIESESSFSQAIGYKARIGEAISAYYLKKTSKSISLFKQSILLAETDNERHLSLYNAAVCSFYLGDYIEAEKLFSDANRYINNKNTLKLVVLSKYLADLVRAQIARDNSSSKKKKSSEGKKTISSVDFVFDDDINLRLEDSESSDSETINQFQSFVSDKALVDSLVTAGINAVKIKDNASEQQLASFVDIDILYEFSSLDSASYTPSNSISNLWKRIFEQEEGYPASLDKTEVIPGVRPW